MGEMKQYTAVLVLGLILLSNGCTSESGNNMAMLKAEVDSILQSQVDLGMIPGAVIMIKKDNRVICRKAYGYALNMDTTIIWRPGRRELL